MTAPTAANEGDRGLRRLLVRLAAGHVIAYPMAFVAAVASMPWSIVVQAKPIENTALRIRPEGAVERWLVERVQLSIPDAAAFGLIMRPVTALMVLVFVACHVAAWRWGQRADATSRSFTKALAVGAGAMIAAGVVGWAVIFLGA